jgi:hypothetical protein
MKIYEKQLSMLSNTYQDDIEKLQAWRLLPLMMV